jgi:hypothetical protein
MNTVARPSQETWKEDDSYGGRWKKCSSGQIEMAGDSFAKVDLQEWK